MTETIITTAEQIEKAFIAWNKAYTENPDGFQTVSYTEADAIGSAAYFIQLLHSV